MILCDHCKQEIRLIDAKHYDSNKVYHNRCYGVVMTKKMIEQKTSGVLV